MKKITESQLIEQARGLRAYMSEADPAAPAAAPTGMQAVGDDEGNTTITRPDGSTMVVGPDGKQIMPGSNPNLPSNKGVFNTIGNAIKGTGDFQKPTGFIPATPTPSATPTQADPTKPVTTGDPAVTTGAAPAAPGTEAAKVQRFKELIAKAGGPAGSAALNPATGGSSATTIPSGPGTAVTNESVDYFLNKLRLLESVQLNEALTPEEQAEMDKLATELGSTEVPSPEIAALINQYNTIKKSTTATEVPPNQAAKVPPKAWAKGVLGAGSKGPEVSALQKQLGVPETGVFDAATKAAVIKKQTELKVKPDGAWGPASQAALAAVKPTVPPVPPVDSRSGYEKIMPNFLGGKSAPAPTQESVTFGTEESLARIVDLARR